MNVPSIFDNPVPTLTPVNKSAGQSKSRCIDLQAIGVSQSFIANLISLFLEVSSDSLRGRVFELSLADLNRDAHE